MIISSPNKMKTPLNASKKTLNISASSLQNLKTSKKQIEV